MFDRRVLCHRLFFALKPTPDAERRIAETGGVLAHSLVTRERLHITMFIVDDLAAIDATVVDRLSRVGQAIDAAPVAISLDRLVASRRSTALRPGSSNGPLGALNRQIARLAASAGIAERRGYRFSPHLTLGYRDGPPSSDRVAPIEWIADELVLIHSHVGQTRHETLGSWPLRGPSADQPTLL